MNSAITEEMNPAITFDAEGTYHFSIEKIAEHLPGSIDRSRLLHRLGIEVHVQVANGDARKSLEEQRAWYHIKQGENNQFTIVLSPAMERVDHRLYRAAVDYALAEIIWPRLLRKDAWTPVADEAKSVYNLAVILHGNPATVDFFRKKAPGE